MCVVGSLAAWPDGYGGGGSRIAELIDGRNADPLRLALNEPALQGTPRLQAS